MEVVISKLISDVKVPIGDADWLVDLVLQRTGPALSMASRELRLEAGSALDAWFTSGDRGPLTSLCQNREFVAPFIDEALRGAHKEATEILNLAPRVNFGRLCSIGPGNGIVELFLLRSGLVKDLLVIDIEQSVQHSHGWAAQGSGYASLNKLRAFLEENVLSSVTITTCNPAMQQLPTFEFDLAMSLMSMGFHYPCDEYVDFILRGSASTQGMCLIDRRLDVADTGYQQLLTAFRREVVFENSKWKRELLVRAHQSDAALQSISL